MRVKSWEFWIWVVFITLGAFMESDVIPAGIGLKVATAVLMVLKTITTMAGKPVVTSSAPGLPLPPDSSQR